MANHKSAIKRHRQSLVRNERNRAVRSTVRTETKKMREAIGAGDAEKIQAQLKETTTTIQKAASKGVLTKQTASRRISRLAKQAHAKVSPPAKG